MKLKKILYALLCLTLVLCCAISFISCGDEKCEHTSVDADGKCTECGEQVKEPEKPQDDDGELMLVNDGKICFQIVTASGVGADAILNIDNLIKDMNARTDGSLVRVGDSKGNEKEFEILVGTVKTRGDDYKIDGRDYGYNGYAIKLINEKIVVVAGSDDSLLDAIDHLTKKVIDLPKGSGKIEELAVSTDGLIEKKQNDYNVNEITVAGNDLRNYSIAYGTDSVDKSFASELRDLLYLSTGIYLDTVRLEKLEGNAIIVDTVKGEADKYTPEGFRIYVDADKNLVIETEFPNRLAETAYTFFVEEIEDSRNKRLSYDEDYSHVVNVRDIYYEDFGAKGDGVTDDFNALLATHEYANLYGHVVNSGGVGKIYYIGKGNGSTSIPIKTDTYWHGCKFIFDDYDIAPDDPERKTPIFMVERDGSTKSYSSAKVPVSTLAIGDTTMGDWQPGERVMVILFNSTKRHFIRFGPNEDNGSSQRELVLVNADGTIDPSTPVQWDYNKITGMTVIPVEDTPITISGGSPNDVNGSIVYNEDGTVSDNLGKRAIIETIFNNAPSAYTYYARNIQISRSNVTIKNIQHILNGDTEREHAAPYSGFTSVRECENVTLSGFIFHKQVDFSTTGAAGTSVGMGSYEMSAGQSNNILWRDSYQINFFEKDGSIGYDGTMGTNYCKNLNFDNMFTCSFDAHCGTYNATVKNSVIEHLNFIGKGTIKLENVTMYTDGSRAAMIFRSDYGATWQGDVVVDGLTMKTSKASPTLTLIETEWINHDFGYVTYLPEKITLNDARIVRYSFGISQDGTRWEEAVDVNHVPLHIYSLLEQYSSIDISDPDAHSTIWKNDYTKCNCSEVYADCGITNDDGTPVGFNDTDGDGRCNNKRDPLNSTYNVWCWGFEEEPDKTANANPYVPTEEVYVTNCGDLTIILPDTPQFKDTKLYIDGVLQTEE